MINTMTRMPQETQLRDQNQYRIIPSVFPTVNFFEDIVDASEMEMLWEIEGLTNERLRQETGDIFLVPPEDRVGGHGASIVMASFTHIGRPSRFSDGSFGVYYASLSSETAIHETVYHRERFLSATKEPPCEITMRLYRGKVVKALHDIRSDSYKAFYHPLDYTLSQEYGREIRDTKSWGLIYNSVRHHGGTCLAIFRPPAISLPEVITHLRYVWNGNKIDEVFDVKSVLSF